MIPSAWIFDKEALMASTGDGPQGQGEEEPHPRTKLMQEVAEQMDAIEADFGDEYKIGRVITIVEVITPDGEVTLRVRAGQYPWVAMGMLDFAKKSVESQLS
jgi:hypothetical protein